MIPNKAKHYATYENMSPGSNGVDWVRIALIASVHPVLHRVSCGYEMIPNAPKH